VWKEKAKILRIHLKEIGVKRGGVEWGPETHRSLVCRFSVLWLFMTGAGCHPLVWGDGDEKKGVDLFLLF
jgi:hypothetical protein